MTTRPSQEQAVPPQADDIRQNSATAVGRDDKKDGATTTHTGGGIELDQLEEQLKVVDKDHLPSPEEVIEQLNIPNWRELQKKLIFRLDITLLPMLW